MFSLRAEYVIGDPRRYRLFSGIIRYKNHANDIFVIIIEKKISHFVNIT